jgi:hypothetical protein
MVEVLLGVQYQQGHLHGSCQPALCQACLAAAAAVAATHMAQVFSETLSHAAKD